VGAHSGLIADLKRPTLTRLRLESEAAPVPGLRLGRRPGLSMPAAVTVEPLVKASMIDNPLCDRAEA
jgi:hypothetical protein